MGGRPSANLHDLQHHPCDKKIEGLLVDNITQRSTTMCFA